MTQTTNRCLWLTCRSLSADEKFVEKVFYTRTGKLCEHRSLFVRTDRDFSLCRFMQTLVAIAFAISIATAEPKKPQQV